MILPRAKAIAAIALRFFLQSQPQLFDGIIYEIPEETSQAISREARESESGSGVQ